MADPLAAPSMARRVLIVDDDELVRDSISAEVESLGHDVVPVDSGQAACDVLATGAVIDVILTDLNLHGGMDGKTLLAAVRANYPHIRGILMSGSLTRDADFGDDGIVALPKPFTRAQLRTALVPESDL